MKSLHLSTFVINFRHNHRDVSLEDSHWRGRIKEKIKALNCIKVLNRNPKENPHNRY